VARRTGKVRELEHDLPAILAVEQVRCLGERGHRSRRKMAESGHYNIDSTMVRAHVSAAGGKGGFINELLAARGAGSPVKFTVSVMQRDDRSPSSSRRDKRPIAKNTKH
jgi:hypothetical protein